jgi:hypothetical protein
MPFTAFALAVAAGSLNGVGCDKASVTDATTDVASVVVSPPFVSMKVPETAQLTATLRDAAGRVIGAGSVRWSTSNSSVATVSSVGLVTAVTSGDAVVTATSNGKTGNTNVTVSAVDRIAVSPSTASIAAGSTQQFQVAGYDAANNVVSTHAVSWDSSNPSVASVNSSGVAIGLGAGVATISASADGKTDNATMVVTTAASCTLVDGFKRLSTSSLAKPGYLQSAVDPEFGTTLTRVSGDPGTPIPVVGGTWPTVVYGNYPKDPAWTADGKLLVLKHMSGALGAGWSLVLDGSTYQPLFKLGAPAGGGGEWRLHPTLPDVAVYLNPTTGAAGHWNIRTNVTTQTVAGVSGYTNHELGPSEGNVSYSGRYLVGKAVRSSDSHVVARVLDLDGGTTGPVIDLTAAGLGAAGLDWVSISAGGGYVVAQGDFRNVNDTRYLRVWSATTGALVQAWDDYILGHADLGIDAAGEEVIFSALTGGPYNRQWITRRLRDGQITALTPQQVTSYDYHASTRLTARPGWSLGVTNDAQGYTLDGEIYLMKLDGSRTIQRLAHHRAIASGSDYNAYPFPTPSPDGKRVLFSSNWGASRPVQAYVLDTRPICP